MEEGKVDVEAAIETGCKNCSEHVYELVWQVPPDTPHPRIFLGEVLNRGQSGIGS